MYVEVAGGAAPRVVQPEDLKRLEVRVLAGSAADTEQALAGSGLGRVEGGDVAWLDVAALRSACGPQSTDWAEQFSAMIAYAGRSGWLSEDGHHVRAHITGPAPVG